MDRTSWRSAATLAAGLLLLLSATAVVASPPCPGCIQNPQIRADGTVSGKFKVNIPAKIKLEGHDGMRVVNQELTIIPGGHTGWHSHPGPALVTVKSGTFRYQQTDCSFTDYGVGQTVVDPGGGHVHIGRNPSSSAALDLAVTYLLPPGAPLRTEADEVDCPPG